MMVPKKQRQPDDPRCTPVFLRGELIRAGYNDKAIARQVRDQVWVKVRRGAYANAEAWKQLDDAGRHGVIARAVLKQAKADVVLSHVSGLPEYDVPVWGLDLSEVHVTRTDGRAGRRESGVDQHCGLILPGDVVHRNAVPVMTATRLALEVTTLAPAEPSLVVINHLLHEKETTPELLVNRYALMDHWPRTLITDLVLRLADGRIESVGESRFLYLCFRQGLPSPVPQLEIKDASGGVLYRVDFAWPELGVFLEFDGLVKYEKLLKPGQRASEVVIAEKKRESEICRLTGWRCIRITWADLARPERTAALIREILFPATAA